MNFNFCNQKKLFRENHIPINREEITCPDPNFTTEQLNMRRKVEILKYKKNGSMNNQTTRRQRFALLARGNYNRQKLPCTSNTIQYTSSSKTDVPGSILLYEDPNVPLTDYNTNNINRYTSDNGININSEIREWMLYIYENIIISNNLIGVLTIYEGIKMPSYTYTFSTPVLTTFFGNNLNSDLLNARYTYTINNITLNIYFNDDIIQTKQTVPTINSCSYTVSSIDSTFPFNYNFDFFHGLITFDNITLPTSRGFSYEFKISFNSSVSINSDNSIEKTENILNTFINSTTYINNTKSTFNKTNVIDYTIDSTDNNTHTITAI